MKIIVAHYNENIEWTKQFLNVTIYNKGIKIKGYNEIILHNVGREGHTYYKYIYDNYDNLEDYTIFLQGNPFDHSPNIIDNLNKYIMNYNNKNLNIDFEFLSEQIIECNLSGCSHHPGIPLIDVYEKLFDERKKNMDFIFGAGAQFIVSKKQIKNNPKDFYLKIIEILEKDINPIEGFVIERFHKIIFSQINSSFEELPKTIITEIIIPETISKQINNSKEELSEMILNKISVTKPYMCLNKSIKLPITNIIKNSITKRRKYIVIDEDDYNNMIMVLTVILMMIKIR